MSARLEGIQHLRGLCASVVVVSHCNGIISKPEYYGRFIVPDLHIASLFAVAVFFAISGFIILLSSTDRRSNSYINLSAYLKKRSIRILPFFFCAVIGYNVLSWVGTGIMDWSMTALTLMLWPLGELKPNVAWSLRHEIFFYLFFAWAMLSSVRKFWIWPTLALLSMTFYLTTYSFHLFDDFEDNPLFEIIKLFAGGDHGANFQFIIGMLVALLFFRLSDSNIRFQQLPAAILYVAMAFASVVVTLWPWDLSLGTSLLWTILSGLILYSAVLTRPSEGVMGRIGQILGDASFSIYLTHNPIILILLVASKRFSMNAELLAPFLIMATLIAIAGGVMIHYLIEAPMIRFFTNRIKTSRRAVAPT